jgi:hypothetical protein
MHEPIANQQLITGIAALVFAVVLVRRTLRPQLVRTWALIATPVVVVLLALLVIWHSPPQSFVEVLILVAGGVAGVGLGYARGIHSKVKLGPEPGTLIVEGNGLLVAILLGAYALRMIVRAVFGTSGSLGLAVSDGFLVFAVASVGVARGMLYLIWRRLTATSRATTNAASTTNAS